MQFVVFLKKNTWANHLTDVYNYIYAHYFRIKLLGFFFSSFKKTLVNDYPS